LHWTQNDSLTYPELGREFIDNSEFSRRNFLLQSLTGVGAAWLAAQWPEILAAHDHAMQAVASPTPPPLEFFTPAQAVDVEAITAAIIPTTDTPGAREAGVVYFIDRGLSTFAKDQRDAFVQGLAVVSEMTKQLFPAAQSFASLTGDQQVQLLTALEAMKSGQDSQTPQGNRAKLAKLANVDGSQIFGLFRFSTILGCFSNPEYGGNRNHVGWDLMNFKPAMAHFPPFGYYDKEYREQHRPEPEGKTPEGGKPEANSGAGRGAGR
jgi:gluconate 2-dehydrogenase gamma chain